MSKVQPFHPSRDLCDSLCFTLLMKISTLILGTKTKAHVHYLFLFMYSLFTHNILSRVSVGRVLCNVELYSSLVHNNNLVALAQ